MRRTLLLLPLLAVTVTAAAPTDPLGIERQRLRDARSAKAAAEARVVALDGQARNALGEAERSARALDALRAQTRATEADLATAEARLALVRGLQREREARLGQQQQPVVELMAAIESRRRRPPVLALLRPGSVTDLVHTRAVLATVAPAVAERTAALHAEVEQARALRRTALAAVAEVRAARGRLTEDQARLAAAEAAARASGERLSGEALSEGDRALALGEEAFDIADRLGTLATSQTTAAKLAALPTPALRPGTRPPSAPIPGTTPSPYRLPLEGPLLTGLGELSGAGVTAKGLSLRATRGRIARAPAAGRVAYAGPYRSYGAIVVLDHGGGWTTLVTGLGAVGVAVGVAVAAGQPLGRAAGEPMPVTVELRRGDRVIDALAL